MAMQFYASPEQVQRDRSEYARKGIARGRSAVVLTYEGGVLFVAENLTSLRKISEIYDRIGFAAVGRYNEFENLRRAGVRMADLNGFSYDRRDVTGRGLANAYAQLLGTIFSSGGEKPYEVEIIVAELGASRGEDQIYRLTYDGSVGDEQGFAVMGGSADVIAEVVGRGFQPDLGLADATRLAVQSLSSDGGPNAEPRTLGVEALEVAILDRGRTLPRKFRRIRGERLAALLSDQVPPEDRGHEAPAAVPPQPAMAETDLTGPASTSTAPSSSEQTGTGGAGAGPTVTDGPAGAADAGPGSSAT